MTGEDLRRIYFPLIISALLSACSSGPEPSEQVEVTVPTNQLLSNNPDLFQFYNEWHGTPYRLGGTQNLESTARLSFKEPLSKRINSPYQGRQSSNPHKALS